MNLIFPDSLLVEYQLNPEKVIISDPPAAYPGYCPNCGGLDFMYATFVESGPYKSVPATGKAHWIDGKWYRGDLRGYPCPVCNGGREQEFLTANCGLEGDDLLIRLDGFTAWEGKENARDVAAQLLSDTPSPIGFVTFHGDYGVGKSHLLKAMVNGFRVAGVPATYTRMADLLTMVREGYSDDAKTAAEAILDSYKSFRVLAIDEVDRINWTPWARETVFRLLDTRYVNQNTYLTVLATNLSPDEFPDDLGYLVSRIKGGIPVGVGGRDMRIGQPTGLGGM